ncbi:beta-lactamase family protein [Niabella pedocola]|uniref:Beta-lactamase family protein n=1 Tax=Niabella pedocola TaxID=1752077 RepID=A0ABS8PN54_9BACT|nr:serine hydrolase domain-containing protein [Niabella pedocola]MCD2422179.1 beta-lactamase family protein [Niabella pedocola]
MKLVYFLTTGLLLTQSALFAQSPAARLDTFFTRLSEDGKLNGNVLVSERGLKIYEHAFGFADVAGQIPNKKSTRFNFASVSKPITATAVLQLVEKRKLKLDDKLKAYLPEFPFDSITIRQLLSHTSGLPNTEELFTPLLEKNPEHIVSNSDVIPQLQLFYRPLHFSPGQRYEYSNVNYCLLALLIEQVSKMTFPQYLEKYIFKPAGMKNTLLQTSENLLTVKKLQATPYLKSTPYANTPEQLEARPELRKWIYNWAGIVGQGNIVSTTEDMLLFDQALHAGKLVSASSLQLMFTPVRLKDGTIPYFRAGIDKAAYGLGWFIFQDTTGGKVVFHSGGIPGINAFLLHNIAKQQVVITIDNMQNASIAPEVCLILSGKPFTYKRSIALAYVRKLLDEGPNDAVALLHTLRTKEAFTLDEGELNFYGLKLFEDHKSELALEVLKLNTLLFPESFNTYDSYAEVLLKVNRKEAALSMYRKSVQLNPKNENAINIIRTIDPKK